MSSTLAQEAASARSLRTAARPLVVVSATSDDTLGGSQRVRLNQSYVTALESAGVVPVIIPPLAGRDAVRSLLPRVDGLVLTGGEDVEPSMYGQERLPECHNANRLRDETEAALVREARERRLPTLAICRGIQIMNAALGGTLFQDIPSQVPGALEHNPPTERSLRSHRVDAVRGSRVAAAIGDESFTVNSFHHQAVRDVAAGLVVTASAPDGLVEALEPAGDDWWMLAVQWHPEEMNDSPEPWDRGLFRAFVDRLREG